MTDPRDPDGANDPPDEPRVTAWSPLRAPLFRAIFLASLITQIARWMHDTSAAWMMTTLTDLPLLVALMQTALVLPVFLLAVPGGVLSDLFDRRRWLIFAQSWLVATAAAIGVLTLLDRIEPWSLLALTFCLGIGTALNMPAMDAIIPELVDRRDLAGAVALKGLTINVARALGPAVGGLLLAVIEPGVVFLVNASAFGLVVLVLLRWKRRSPPQVEERPGFVEALRIGMRYTRQSPEMRACLIRATLWVLAASALWSLLPLVARQAGLGPAGYGWLLGVVGSGAVLGVMMMTRARRRFGVDVVMGASLVLAAIGLVGFATVRVFLPLMAFAFVSGIGWVGYAATMNTVVQQVLPAWVRARAIAIYIVVQQGAMALGAAVWGTTATIFTVSTALLASSVALVACVWTVRRWPLAGYPAVR